MLHQKRVRYQSRVRKKDNNISGLCNISVVSYITRATWNKFNCVLLCVRELTDTCVSFVCVLLEFTPYAQLQHTNGGGGRTVSQLNLKTERHDLTCTE